MMVARSVQGLVQYLITDHLGTPTLVLNTNGSVAFKQRMDAWGNERFSQSTDQNGFRFTGQRYDDTLGLHDYNARYYDAENGRFLSADTIIPFSEGGSLTVGFHEVQLLATHIDEFKLPASGQVLNRFSYVGNNPSIYTDPTGHSHESPVYTYSFNNAQVDYMLQAWELAIHQAARDSSSEDSYTGGLVGGGTAAGVLGLLALVSNPAGWTILGMAAISIIVGLVAGMLAAGIDGQANIALEQVEMLEAEFFSHLRTTDEGISQVKIDGQYYEIENMGVERVDGQGTMISFIFTITTTDGQTVTRTFDDMHESAPILIEIFNLTEQHGNGLTAE